VSGRDGWDEDWRSFPKTPRQPPPAHGIKMKKAGSTWWGQRWIDALEKMSLDYSKRLARGRSYARAGRTHDLAVASGEVTARVTGSRPEPYEVRLTIPVLSEATWRSAIATMAKTSRFAAELLAGEMPKEIDAAFAAHGASLFPAKPADLVTECSCPDWANPCKHVTATHYVLGEALDRDPFLLFELRGRSRRQVMDALRAARTGKSAAATGRARKGERRARRDAEQIETVSLAKVSERDFDELRAPLPALHFAFEEPAALGAGLRQLGTPPGWSRADAPADLLGPAAHAAAERARALALAEAEPGGAGGGSEEAAAERASAQTPLARDRPVARRSGSRGKPPRGRT
jgi:uncharacterized Zn finger protein